MKKIGKKQVIIGAAVLVIILLIILLIVLIKPKSTNEPDNKSQNNVLTINEVTPLENGNSSEAAELIKQNIEHDSQTLSRSCRYDFYNSISNVCSIKND